MQLDRNAKGAIIFSMMMVIAQLWMATSPVFDPPWEPWPPIVPFMGTFAVPFMVNFFRPALMALTGLAILWVWEGKRSGYLLALILALITSLFGVVVFLLNALNQEWLGTLTALATHFPAVMALFYSFKGYRE